MYKRYISLVLLAGLLLTACDDKVFDPVLKIGAAPAISSPAAGSSFVLTEADADKLLTTFSWSAADFGFQAAVDYAVELDVAGNDFADPATLGIVSGLQLETVTVGQMNNLLISKGLPDNVPAQLELRVVATVNPDVPPVVSEVVPLSITPYKTVVVYPKLQVPGSYQGWDPANESTVIHSRKSDGLFEGYIYFPNDGAEFKYTDGPSWDVNWGDTGADGTLDRDGDNIVAGDLGMYKLNVDLNALTHTFLKTDWGLIGSATPGGWDSDQDMTYLPESGVWRITLDLQAGEVKFRANDDWAINFGDDDGNGSLEYGGANIVIAEAGNYTIDLMLSVQDYTYQIVKN